MGRQRLVRVSTGSCAITETAPGSYSLTASYPGDADFADSATATARTETVGKASTKTQLTLSTGSVTFGHEQQETFAVTEKPQYSGSPSGTVTVSTGQTVLCAATLSASGVASCSHSSSALAIGSWPVSATYKGSSSFKGSHSSTKTVKVS